MSQRYNKKVHSREFQVGELILRENPKNQQNRAQKGMLELDWLGPYILITSFGFSACQLSMPEGD